MNSIIQDGKLYFLEFVKSLLDIVSQVFKLLMWFNCGFLSRRPIAIWPTQVLHQVTLSLPPAFIISRKDIINIIIVRSQPFVRVMNDNGGNVVYCSLKFRDVGIIVHNRYCWMIIKIAHAWKLRGKENVRTPVELWINTWLIYCRNYSCNI